MSDCHDRLHPSDDRRNQSANATGGNAEKLTNHVMGGTARPRNQRISERFRFAGCSVELRSPPMTVPRALSNVGYRGVSSIGQCNTSCSLLAGVSKAKVFRGR